MSQQNLFHYTDMLKWTKKDVSTSQVMSITFYLQPGGCGKPQTIKFKHPILKKIAIMTVEEWLSKPVTKSYFNKNKEPYDACSWKEAQNWCRGDLLGSSIFLEVGNIDPDGNMFLECGS